MGKRSAVGDVLDALRAAVPTRYPVRWSWARDIPDGWADCELRTKGAHRFHLRIKSGISDPALTHLLIHEYAHAVCWDYVERIKERHHHPPEFWLAVGRCWDVIYGVRE